MASAQSDPMIPVTTEVRASRRAQLLRAAVLFLSGMAITFTATSHGDVQFDLYLLGSSLVLIALATFVEYYSLRGTSESWWVAARAVIALGAAGSLVAVTDSASMALIIAVWAGLTGLITLMRMIRKVQPQRVALPSLLLSVALLVSVLLVQQDAIAVIGFFGAYAVLRGVFLAISAFDGRATAEESEETFAAESGANTTSGTKDD